MTKASRATAGTASDEPAGIVTGVHAAKPHSTRQRSRSVGQRGIIGGGRSPGRRRPGSRAARGGFDAGSPAACAPPAAAARRVVPQGGRDAPSLRGRERSACAPDERWNPPVAPFFSACGTGVRAVSMAARPRADQALRTAPARRRCQTGEDAPTRTRVILPECLAGCRGKKPFTPTRSDPGRSARSPATRGPDGPGACPRRGPAPRAPGRSLRQGHGVVPGAPGHHVRRQSVRRRTQAPARSIAPPVSSAARSSAWPV
jgi:hypothetical protein